MPIRDIILIAVVVLCSLLAVGRPVFGILCFIGFSILNPHSMTWGSAKFFPFAQFLAIGTLLGTVFWLEPKRLPMTRVVKWMALLWLWFIPTTYFADHSDLAWQAFTHISKILLMVFLSMVLINTRRRLFLLMRVIGMTLGFLGLKGGVFFILTGGQQMVYGPEESFLEGNNSFGLALAMNIPILYYLLGVETNRHLRRVYWAMLLFTFPAIVGTFSRGAWVGLAAGVFFMFLKSRNKFLWSLGAFLLAMAFVPFLSERVLRRYDDLVNYQEEGSTVTRLWNWEFATEVTKAHPLLGAGFDYYGLDAYEKYFPIFLEAYPGKIWSCHSIWFTMVSEHGIPGLAIWIFLILSALWTAHRLKVLGRRDPDRAWVIPYAQMVHIGLIPYLVSGTFFDGAYFDLFYQLLACLAIQCRLTEAAPAGASSALQPAPAAQLQPELARP